MDEKNTLQQDVAKAKIKIIISSICEAIILIMELYIMINYKGYFVAMAFGILCMVVGLFFLISGVMDVTMKTKAMEAEKYEDIYNAQKASYLVIRKSFDELDARLRNIEENGAIPAEEIISAQKAVAKVTITRSKENTDALMNSNDELINQLFAIQEKMDSSNNELLEKQQALLNATRDDLQQKISELTAQISSIEGRMAHGVAVETVVQAQMPQLQQAVSTVEPVKEMSSVEPEPTIDTKPEDIQVPEPLLEQEDILQSVNDDIVPESIEETIVDTEIPISEEMVSELETGNMPIESTVQDIADDFDLDSVIPEVTDADSGLITETESMVPNSQEVEPAMSEGAVVQEVVEEAPAIDDIMQSVEEMVADDPEISVEVEEEPVLTETAVEEEQVLIPTDTGVDLSDPNRVMSPEEIEKLFASL